MPQHLQDPNAAPKLHTQRAAVACVQLHADDVAVTGQGFIILFRFFPRPNRDKTETQGVTIQHADVQEASSGPAAALLQTRCRSLEAKKAQEDSACSIQ